METNSASEKVTKKKEKTKFGSRTVCTHSKWANEQTLKTELRIPCMFTAFSRTDPFFFSPTLLAKKHTPPLSKKLPAVIHILSYQTACEVTSRRCDFACLLSAKKTIVYYLVTNFYV